MIFAGCSTKVEYIYIYPDPALTQPIEKPVFDGQTCRDLAKVFALRGAAIDQCNNQLDLLREQSK